jgi:hypothetical protein
MDADVVERRRMRRARRSNCPFSKSLNFISISWPWEHVLLMDAFGMFSDDLFHPIVSGREDLIAQVDVRLELDERQNAPLP